MLSPDLQQFYAQTIQRKADLEQGVFRHPPSDWAEFQRRLGQWQELELSIREVDTIAKGEEI